MCIGNNLLLLELNSFLCFSPGLNNVPCFWLAHYGYKSISGFLLSNQLRTATKANMIKCS